jgi:hypothetical protein
MCDAVQAEFFNRRWILRNSIESLAEVRGPAVKNPAQEIIARVGDPELSKLG